MDRKLLKKLAIVFIVFIFGINFWLDIGSEWLLDYMLRTRVTPIAFRNFERMNLIIPGAFVLLTGAVILKICFDAEDPEEGEE